MFVIAFILVLLIAMIAVVVIMMMKKPKPVGITADEGKYAMAMCNAGKYPTFSWVKYGANDKFKTDVAPYNTFCKDKSECTFNNYNSFSGDPVPGVPKNFSGEYTCIG